MLSRSINLYKKLQKQYSKRINLDLNRINKVLKKLKNPHLDLKNPINILGSDGKFSVLTSLQHFLEADNKKVTTFTSPHLYDLRHRFWLKNKFISINKINKLKKIIEKTAVKLTLFEFLTCIYILAAKNEKNIKFNLIESGLLFKKDSTNLWKEPKIQIVTNINYQHQDWVSPKTITEICKQKVGYLSEKTTIYVAPQDAKVLKIIKKILKKNPSKKIYSSSWRLVYKKNSYFYKDKQNSIPLKLNYVYSKGLISNLCLAIKVALDLGVPKKNILKVIPKIRFQGRIQYINNGKLKNLLGKNEKLLVDGCHSIQSAKNLFNYLKTLNEPIYGIWGMQKNKLPDKFISSFNDIFSKIYTVTIPNEPNSLSSNMLKTIGKNFGNKIESASSVKESLIKVSNNKKKTIVIFGSLYLVGDVLSKN
jgi:dihydrofolate synthase/folylpolyglutamate synthase